MDEAPKASEAGRVGPRMGSSRPVPAAQLGLAATRVPPEDPDDVRRRDLERRRGEKLPRRPRQAPNNDASWQSKARVAANAEFYSRSPEARRVVTEGGDRWGHRFTDAQWTILVLAYGYGFSDGDIGDVVGMDSSNVRRARQVAEEIAYELLHEVEPVLKKQRRGEALTDEERSILRRHAHAKKGRKAVGYRAQEQELGPLAVGETGAPEAAQGEWTGSGGQTTVWGIPLGSIKEDDEQLSTPDDRAEHA